VSGDSSPGRTGSVEIGASRMWRTGDNMAKSSMMMGTMPDGAGKMGMTKEMAMANMEMSKGKMKDACAHYMKAQKMGMMK